MDSDVEWSSVSEDQWDVQIRVPMGFVTTMYWKSMALTLVEVVQEVVSCGVEGHVVWSKGRMSKAAVPYSSMAEAQATTQEE